MMRGYVSGALWGVVVAGLGAGVASVATGPVVVPPAHVPEAASGAPGAPDAPQQPLPDALPSATPGDGASPQTASPGIPEPDSGAEAADGVADTASTGRPEAGEASALAQAPEAAEVDTATLARPVSDPALSEPQTRQPDAPAADELSISVNPSQPPAPAVEEAAPHLGAPEADALVETPEAESPIAAEAADPSRATAETASEPAVATEAPSAAPEAEDAAPRTATSPEASAPPPSPAPEPAAPEVSDSPAAPPVADEAPQVAEAPAAPAPPPPAPEDPEVRPRVTLLTESGETDVDRPMVGKPARSLIGRGENAQDTPPETTETPAKSAADGPTPLVQFSEPVDLAEDKPLMSIILIDDGGMPLGLEALESFPYPITFAIDTAWEGATEAMRAYRDAGFEVMALANLPDGAQPQDAEVTLNTVLTTVPEAVAVLEGDAGGLQASRQTSEQVARILAETGHGLVLYPQGLNTGQALAARVGVPASVLFRDFDGSGQTATVMRRFLDQAAFKAGQEGQVIMLGRLQPETISALLIWGLQDRASRVAFVPVSQVLAGDGG